MTLGVELRDASATAVAVDADGRVTARAEQAVDGDRAAGLAALLGRVWTSQAAAGLGLAVNVPGQPGAAGLPASSVGPHRVITTAASGTSAAVAEAWVGAARGAADVVYFSVGEHVAAGVIRGGEPMTGAHRYASAVAWMSLNPVEREDYRRVGCLETEVGEAGLVRRLVWRVKAGDGSAVEDIVSGDLNAVTVDHVLSAARDGDGVSVSVVRDTARYLGMAAANLLVIVDPEVLVLGGLMALAEDLLLEPVRAELARRMPAALVSSVRVVPAALGADAAAIGAARLAALAG